MVKNFYCMSSMTFTIDNLICELINKNKWNDLKFVNLIYDMFELEN